MNLFLFEAETLVQMLHDAEFVARGNITRAPDVAAIANETATIIRAELASRGL